MAKTSSSDMSRGIREQRPDSRMMPKIGGAAIDEIWNHQIKQRRLQLTRQHHGTNVLLGRMQLGGNKIDAIRFHHALENGLGAGVGGKGDAEMEVHGWVSRKVGLEPQGTQRTQWKPKR